MTKDATPGTPAGDKTTTDPAAPQQPPEWVIPEEVIFKAWAEASRLQDLHARGSNPEHPFTLERARQQWDDLQIAPSAQAFALEILKWAADRRPATPKPTLKKPAGRKNPGKA